MRTDSGRTTRRCVRACLLLLIALGGGAAQAAIYVGTWDPAYGAPFTNLGWRGSAQYYVPNYCEPPGTLDISNVADCGGAAAVVSASVELYDVAAVGQPTLDTLVFTPASLVVGTLRYVSGQLTELTTGFSDLVGPVADLSAFGVSPTTDFFLDFTLAGPRLGWYETECNVNIDGFAGPQDVQCGGSNDGVNFPPRFAITEVPEPAALWLAGSALLALVPTRRRRRSAA